MFRSISWMTFFIAILSATAAYYCWWLVRYYPLLVKGKKGASGTVPGQEKKEETKAGQKEHPLPVPEKLAAAEAVFLPKIAGEVANQLSRLEERALLEKMTKDAVLETLQQLVRGEQCAKLRGTAWEEKINGLIVRVCEKYGPGRPELHVVKGWWTGENG